jgi:hypothetical protein
MFDYVEEGKMLFPIKSPLTNGVEKALNSYYKN